MKDLFEGVMVELMDAKADLLFDSRFEDMEDGDAADFVLLAIASIEQANRYLNLAVRRVEE